MNTGNKLESEVNKIISSRAGAHGIDHIMRVRKVALEIAEREGARKDIVEAMALLHDLVRYEDEREQESVEETIKQAKEILNKTEMPDDDKSIILDGIESHSLHSKARKEPSTLEAKILFDADKIDSVGRIGVARWFMTMDNRGLSIRQIAEIYLMTIEQITQKMESRMYTKAGTEMIKEGLEYSVAFMKDLIKDLE